MFCRGWGRRGSIYPGTHCPTPLHVHIVVKEEGEECPEYTRTPDWIGGRTAPSFSEGAP